MAELGEDLVWMGENRAENGEEQSGMLPRSGRSIGWALSRRSPPLQIGARERPKIHDEGAWKSLLEVGSHNPDRPLARSLTLPLHPASS